MTSALRATHVPVPDTVTLCRDADVIGAPFYLMEFVDGTCYRRADELEPLGPTRTTNAMTALVDTFAALHRIDPHSVGLGDFGRPQGFLERQLHRWAGQLDASRCRDLDGIDDLRARLTRQLPGSGKPAIVHGDYRLDNVLVAPDDQVAAVLDWEMATLGDPLTDLGVLIAYSECGQAGITVVVNVASIGALRASPGIGMYGVSKAALIRLTMELAHELGPEIRVNGVAPGIVKTSFSSALYDGRETKVAAAYPLQRLGEADDVTGAVAFLLSSDAAWITGQTLAIDGGTTLGGGL